RQVDPRHGKWALVPRLGRAGRQSPRLAARRIPHALPLAARARRGRRRARRRVLPLVVHRQLRVGRGLQRAIRPRLLRLRDAKAHREAFGAVVRGAHPDPRRVAPFGAMTPRDRAARPGTWVPSSYFAEGIPFAMVIWVAGTMFKDLGHSDGEITLATASIGIAWSLKPLWAAFLDMYRTKKFFVLATEFAMSALFAAMALALPLPGSFRIVMALLWVLAFFSA